MKNLLVIGLTVAFLPSAFAAKKTASLDDLEQAVMQENRILVGAELDCKVSMIRTAASLVIAAADTRHSVTLEISNSDQIRLDVKRDSDGTDKSFTIRGLGTVRLISASDAFDSIEVSDGRTSVNCEVDY